MPHTKEGNTTLSNRSGSTLIELLVVIAVSSNTDITSGLVLGGKVKRRNIERKFAEQKNNHGLGKVRYWDLAKVAIQVLLTCIVVNCEKIVRLLSAGVCPNNGRLCPTVG